VDSVPGATMSDGQAAIRKPMPAPLECVGAYRRALARWLGLGSREAAALLHVRAAGSLTADALRLALVLSAEEAEALVDGLVARGRLVVCGDRLRLTPPEAERLAVLLQPFVDALDAVGARLSPHERAIVGRYLEAAVAVGERHAREMARRALDEPSPSA